MATIIGVILVFFSLIAFIFSGTMIADDDTCDGGVASFISLILFAAGTLIIHVGKPAAIDVYRGKTTLQITYKNNVPIDSTVVYK